MDKNLDNWKEVYTKCSSCGFRFWRMLNNPTSKSYTFICPKKCGCDQMIVIRIK